MPITELARFGDCNSTVPVLRPAPSADIANLRASGEFSVPQDAVHFCLFECSLFHPVAELGLREDSSAGEKSGGKRDCSGCEDGCQ